MNSLIKNFDLLIINQLSFSACNTTQDNWDNFQNGNESVHDNFTLNISHNADHDCATSVVNH